MTQPAAARNGSGLRTAGSNDHLLVVLATPSGCQQHLDSTALRQVGLRVVAVNTMDDLRGTLLRAAPDLAVVDAAIADDRGTGVLALVRGASTPLIAVAVRDPAVRVELLLAGMDDCLPSPYTSEELAARAIAIGRRVHPVVNAAAHVLRGGPIQLDMCTHRVQVLGSEVALTAMEFALLECLLRHPGEALSRERLLAEVWGYASGAAQTVTVHIRRLRSKVEPDPNRPVLIQTIWGIGYRLCADDQSDADPPRRTNNGYVSVIRTVTAAGGEAGMAASGAMGVVNGRPRLTPARSDRGQAEPPEDSSMLHDTTVRTSADPTLRGRDATRPKDAPAMQRARSRDIQPGNGGRAPVSRRGSRCPMSVGTLPPDGPPSRLEAREDHCGLLADQQMLSACLSAQLAAAGACLVAAVLVTVSGAHGPVQWGWLASGIALTLPWWAHRVGRRRLILGVGHWRALSTSRSPRTSCTCSPPG